MELRFELPAIAICALISGCGVVPPTIAEPGGATYPGVSDPASPTPQITASGQLEFEIKENIYCELWKAVNDLKQYSTSVTTDRGTTKSPLLPDNWGAQLSLSLEVDDNGALNPSLSIIKPFNSMTDKTFGLGATLSSTASRNDKFNSFFNVGYLRSKYAIQKICIDYQHYDPFLRAHFSPARSSFMVSDLGIEPWLTDALFVNRGIPSYGTASSGSTNAAPSVSSAGSSTSSPGTVSGSKPAANSKKTDNSQGQQDAVSLEIKFIVVTNGNLNPSWKLVRVSADTGSNPLVAAGRTRTHDMILTVGPNTNGTDFANLALQIGQAVGASSRASLVSGGQ